MQYRIESTTDGRFVGMMVSENDIESGIIKLLDDRELAIERIVKGDEYIVIITTNYQMTLKGA